jgi:hypothetical protein
MVAAKKEVELRDVAARDESPLDPRYDEMQSAFNALEQIDALPQIKQQIRKQTLRARDALEKIWRVVRGMQLSEYFDPHIYAALHFEHSERKRDAQRKATEAKNKKKDVKPTEHPLSARALKLYSHYKPLYPRDALSVEGCIARDLGITLSALQKEILKPARDAGRLRRFNAKPEKTAQSR